MFNLFRQKQVEPDVSRKEFQAGLSAKVGETIRREDTERRLKSIEQKLTAIAEHLDIQFRFKREHMKAEKFEKGKALGGCDQPQTVSTN